MNTKKLVKNWKPKRWNPKVDCNLNFSNNYLSEECPEILKDLNSFSKDQWFKRGEHRGFFRSLPISIQNFSLVFDQVRVAKRYMNEIIWCLSNMGFEVNVKKVYWHNVLDSCANIGGYLGCFIVEFDFKKSKKEKSK